MTWFIHMCAMPHSHTRHDAWTCVTWLIHTYDTTHSHVWWRIHVHDTTHPHVWHDSKIPRRGCCVHVPCLLSCTYLALSYYVCLIFTLQTVSCQTESARAPSVQFPYPRFAIGVLCVYSLDCSIGAHVVLVCECVCVCQGEVRDWIPVVDVC